MKSQIKNFGKELSRNELMNVFGGGTAYYMCANGTTGQIRNVDPDEFANLPNPCGKMDAHMWMSVE